MLPLRILIAEDDHMQSAILELLITTMLGKLITAPIQITVVTTLREALIQSEHHNATLLDLMLEDTESEDEVVNSIHLCRRPVIVMTGIHDEALHARCKVEGADVVFTKGEVPERELCRAICEAFAKDVVAEIKAAA